MAEADGAMEAAQKKRIGVFSAYYPEYRNAVFTRLAQVPDLHFVFLGGTPPSGSFIKQSDARGFEYHNIKVRRIPIPRTKNVVTLHRGLLGAMVWRKYDALLLTNDILSPDVWLCCLLSRIFRVPVCVWGQGISRPATRFRDALRYIQIRLAHSVLFYTEGGRNYWLKKGIAPRKLFVAYNALDTVTQTAIRNSIAPGDLSAFAKEKGLDGRKIVTFLGRLVSEKKPDVFVRAVATAARQDRSIVGVLIGDGPQRPSLEHLVQEMGVSECIRFAGAMYDERAIGSYLLLSSAMVLPAFAGLAIQHAGVYGVPVVLGDLPDSHGPEQEIVQHGSTGLWCPDEDVDAFAAAILRLTGDSVFRDALSRNARQVIDTKFNVSTMSQGFISAMHFAMGQPEKQA